MGGNGFGYVFILPNRPHADTDLICVVGVIDFYTLNPFTPNLPIFLFLFKLMDFQWIE